MQINGTCPLASEDGCICSQCWTNPEAQVRLVMDYMTSREIHPDGRVIVLVHL